MNVQSIGAFLKTAALVVQQFGDPNFCLYKAVKGDINSCFRDLITVSGHCQNEQLNWTFHGFVGDSFALGGPFRHKENLIFGCRKNDQIPYVNFPSDYLVFDNGSHFVPNEPKHITVKCQSDGLMQAQHGYSDNADAANFYDVKEARSAPYLIACKDVDDPEVVGPHDLKGIFEQKYMEAKMNSMDSENKKSLFVFRDSQISDMPMKYNLGLIFLLRESSLLALRTVLRRGLSRVNPSKLLDNNFEDVIHKRDSQKDVRRTLPYLDDQFHNGSHLLVKV